MKCNSGHEWSAAVTHLLNSGSACPKCSYESRAINRRTDIRGLTETLSMLPNLSFVGWVDGYRNKSSKVIMRCDSGHTWTTSVSSLIHQNTRCPKCAIKTGADGRRADQGFVLDKLSALPDMRFVRWDCGRYENIYSKVTMICSAGHEWSTSVVCLIRMKTGCPSCAKSGYDPTKPGTLYALRHVGGAHIKIGISNTYKRRLVELRRGTPFEFEVFHIHHCDDGHIIRELEKMFHSHFESSGFTKFDGATEWLKFNPDILSLLRILGA